MSLLATLREALAGRTDLLIEPDPWRWEAAAPAAAPAPVLLLLAEAAVPGPGTRRGRLIELTRGLARAWAPGARVNAIIPGATAADVLRAARYFADAPAVTGQTVALDGGVPRDVWAEAATVRAGGPSGPPLRRVLVRGLELPAHVGVYRHEEGRHQRIRVDLSLGVPDLPPAADRLSEVVDYDPAIAAVRALVAEGHVRLIETLAERIAAACLADPRVHEVTVRIEKLDAHADAEAVGIEIERRRPGQTPEARPGSVVKA